MQLTGNVHFTNDATGLRKTSPGNTRAIPTFGTEQAFADKNGNGIIEVTNNPATCEIIQENHYYPFGLNHEGPWLMNDAARDNLYQYNGKELVPDFNLGLSDFSARWYDTALGKFTNVDPLAASMARHAPYSFSFNNPIAFSDPTGMKPNESSSPSWLYLPGWKEPGESFRWDKPKPPGQESNLPVVYYANVGGFSTEKITKIFEHAVGIFSRNGFPGLRYLQVSVKEAKNHQFTYEKQMFLALLNLNEYGASPPGRSTIFQNGLIGVYAKENVGKAFPFNGFRSWVNLNHSAITQHQGNKDYAAGYIVGHELLHQMLGIASFYKYRDGTKFDYHNNTTPNLNMDGNSVNIPPAPAKNGVLLEAETILPHHREVLRIFLKNR